MIKKTLCFSNPTYLSLDKKQLVIKLPEVENTSNLPNSFKRDAVRTIPIEDIGVILLEHKQITITHALIEALLENNCALITCDSKGLPVGLMLPLYGNTTQNERFRDQLDASLPLKKQLWQQTIQCKIRNQAWLLQRTHNLPVDNMNKWIDNVRSGDIDNMEARAAVYYWKKLFSHIENFTRERDDIPPNNLLNYGYAILRAVIARALVCSGMLPTLGIHHHNRYNAYCLADDIMEPYRPFVDQLVIEIMSKHSNYDTLSKEIKIELLKIPVIDVGIDGKRSPLMVAASQSTASLYKCFKGESRKIMYPSFI